jgi:hypothetical protein
MKKENQIEKEREVSPHLQNSINLFLYVPLFLPLSNSLSLFLGSRHSAIAFQLAKH